MGALLLALLLLPAVGKSVADAVAHNSPRLRRWFPQWAGPQSWRLKYRNGDPAQGPRFAGSTTWLVLATDSWHFANFITWLGWAAASVLACWLGWQGVWWLVAGLVLNKLAFEPLYSFLRK